MNRNDFANVPWWKRVPTLDDLDCQPVHWLVEEFIPEGSLVLLCGKTGDVQIVAGSGLGEGRGDRQFLCRDEGRTRSGSSLLRS